MPFFFVFVGVLLIITGVKDTYVALGNQLAKDFTGERNFFVWVLAFGLIGAIGYVDRLKPVSTMFMVLVLLAMVLTNSNRGDIISLIADGLNNPVTPARPVSTTSAPAGASPARSDMVQPSRAESALDKGQSYLDKGLKLLGTAAKIIAIF